MRVPPEILVEAQGVLPTADARQRFDDVVNWIGNGAAVESCAVRGASIVFESDGETRAATPGDWVIKMPNGVFDVASPETFEMYFEAV
ncbi:MAG: hypothetical protein AAGI03_01905 [Pseudomonadota bacterium]